MLAVLLQGGKQRGMPFLWLQVFRFLQWAPACNGNVLRKFALQMNLEREAAERKAAQN